MKWFQNSGLGQFSCNLIFCRFSLKGVWVSFFDFIWKIWSSLQDRIRFIYYSLAFSNLNFEKFDIHGKEQFGTTYPGIVTVWRIFLAFWSCRPESASMNWWFPAEIHSSGGFLVHELVIPGRNHSSGGFLALSWYFTTELSLLGGFLVLELVIPGRMALYAVLLRTATFAVTIPSVDSSSLS
jgi:hypothetical protein